MYKITFWHGQKLEWRSAAQGTFYDRTQAIRQMQALSDMCDHSVSFRIEAIDEVVTA